jgi:hypothetical protein
LWNGDISSVDVFYTKLLSTLANVTQQTLGGMGGMLALTTAVAWAGLALSPMVAVALNLVAFTAGAYALSCLWSQAGWLQQRWVYSDNCRKLGLRKDHSEEDFVTALRFHRMLVHPDHKQARMKKGRIREVHRPWIYGECSYTVEFFEGKCQVYDVPHAELNGVGGMQFAVGDEVEMSFVGSHDAFLELSKRAEQITKYRLQSRTSDVHKHGKFTRIAYLQTLLVGWIARLNSTQEQPDSVPFLALEPDPFDPKAIEQGVNMLNGNDARSTPLDDLGVDYGGQEDVGIQMRAADVAAHSAASVS